MPAGSALVVVRRRAGLDPAPRPVGLGVRHRRLLRRQAVRAAKFLTHISPSKTYAGLIGGIVASTVVVGVVLAGLGKRPIGALILGPLVGPRRPGRRPRGIDAQAGRRGEGLEQPDPGPRRRPRPGRLVPVRGARSSSCMSSPHIADAAGRRRVAVLGSTGSIGTPGARRPRPPPGRVRGRRPRGGRGRGPRRAGRPVPAGRGRPGVRRTGRAAGRHGRAGEGTDPLVELASRADVDLVVVATGGIVSLRPVLAALAAGKVVATANKETLVAGGHLVMPAARARAAEVAASRRRPVREPARLAPPDRQRALRDLAVPRRRVAGPRRGPDPDRLGRPVPRRPGGPVRR